MPHRQPLPQAMNELKGTVGGLGEKNGFRPAILRGGNKLAFGSLLPLHAQGFDG
ncbi:hypothetical protein M569_17716 [Genlisea aurea]|uniref:Uncharacterized protein n=1 Tax=Genlisea aurea TaxID=192259 RepID=S8D363_9LAMI|nr:hypothetical protein M569_17716 [Genlisea aurea]